jgi:hypothetical protein
VPLFWIQARGCLGGAWKIELYSALGRGQLGHGQLEIQEEFGWSHSKFLLYLDLTITCKPKARRKSLLQLQDAGI